MYIPSLYSLSKLFHKLFLQVSLDFNQRYILNFKINYIQIYIKENTLGGGGGQ